MGPLLAPAAVLQPVLWGWEDVWGGAGEAVSVRFQGGAQAVRKEAKEAGDELRHRGSSVAGQGARPETLQGA